MMLLLVLPLVGVSVDNAVVCAGVKVGAGVGW